MWRFEDGSMCPRSTAMSGFADLDRSAGRQFWVRDVRIDIRAMLGGVNRRTTVRILFVGFVIVAGIAVRSPLFGSYGPVNESQCVRGEGRSGLC